MVCTVKNSSLIQPNLDRGSIIEDDDLDDVIPDRIKDSNIEENHEVEDDEEEEFEEIIDDKDD